MPGRLRSIRAPVQTLNRITGRRYRTLERELEGLSEEAKYEFNQMVLNLEQEIQIEAKREARRRLLSGRVF